METKIQFWGNSLGVRLPKSVSEKRIFTAGSPVVVSEEGNRIVITSLPAQKNNLESLIAQITPENLHGETAWGNARGNEVW